MDFHPSGNDSYTSQWIFSIMETGNYMHKCLFMDADSKRKDDDNETSIEETLAARHRLCALCGGDRRAVCRAPCLRAARGGGECGGECGGGDDHDGRHRHGHRRKEREQPALLAGLLHRRGGEGAL